MITMVANLQAKAGKEDELRIVLSEMVDKVGKAEAEAGKVLVYDLYESESEPGHFLFHEQYANAEALAGHGKTEHATWFRSKLAELLDGPPTVKRYTHLAGVS